MSSSMKLSLLALISTAIAAPHNHRRHNHPSGGYGTGAPYPTGGWHHHNGTHPHPTGTAAAVSTDSPDTTLLETLYSTETQYSTIYASKPAGAQSAGVEDVASSAAPVCGAGGTITVTATNKVTVTVGGPSSSAVAVESSAPASSAAAVSTVAVSSVASSSVSAPAEGYGSYVLPSSSLVEAAPSSSAAAVESSSALAYTAAPVTSAAPSSSAVATSSPVVEDASSTVASSSAAASSTGSVGYSGGKRGLAYNDESLLSAFTGSYGFVYNWAQTGSSDKAPFMPMMHTPSDSTADEWLANVKTSVEGGSVAVMGFNEPDIATQSNMSPEAACSAWSSYMNPIRSNHPDVTILGPSVSNSGSTGQGLDWLKTFQSDCSTAIWDAANIHFYDIPDGALDRFTAHIESAASQTGKKVFVTEFGLNPGSATDEQAAEFLKGAIEYMDGSDSVSGYAYFMVGTGECQLNSGTGLSTVGQVYS